MASFIIPKSTIGSSVIVFVLLLACYATVKRDEQWNSRDGEIDVEFGDYDNSRYSITSSNGDATAKDRDTELVWQLDYQNDMTYEDAIEYCSDLELGRFRDWRLPNEVELRTLVDLGKKNPSSAFPNMPNEWFWTSTQSISEDRLARFVRFDQGDILLADKENRYSVRCVRGEREQPSSVRTPADT